MSLGYSVELVLLNKTAEFIESCDCEITFYDLKCSSFSHAVLPLLTYIVNNRPPKFLLLLSVFIKKHLKLIDWGWQAN